MKVSEEDIDAIEDKVALGRDLDAYDGLKLCGAVREQRKAIEALKADLAESEAFITDELKKAKRWMYRFDAVDDTLTETYSLGWRAIVERDAAKAENERLRAAMGIAIAVLAISSSGPAVVATKMLAAALNGEVPQ